MPSRERTVPYTTGPQLTPHDRLWLTQETEAAVLRPTSVDVAFAVKLPTLTILDCRRPDLAVQMTHTLVESYDSPILRTTITMDPTPGKVLEVPAYSDLGEAHHRDALDRLARQPHLDLYFYNEHVCGIFRKRLANTWRKEQRRILSDARRAGG